MRKPMLSSNALQALSVPSDEEDDGEDEETLQLKLQAIEAKLKLKKLQQAKKRAAEESDTGSRARSDSGNTSPRKRVRLDQDVQIPVSPPKDRSAPVQDKSPARVLLGIDKGLRAQDVSLKRAKIGTASTTTRQPNFFAKPSDLPTVKHKSFSERLADSRMSEQERQAKDERVDKSRGKGFGLGSSSFGDAVTPKGSTRPDQSYSSFKRPLDYQSTPAASTSGSRAPRTDSRPSLASLPSQAGSSRSHGSSAVKASNSPASQKPEQQSHTSETSQKMGSKEADSKDEASFDSFSSLHLSKRRIQHTDLTRALADKELYTLPRLLKEVKSPHYDPPDCETDFVVFGILASKSTPYDTKPRYQASTTTTSDVEDPTPKNKFMVLKLTDLDWEVDVFLFDTAFTAYWKMTPGTVVAILNPAIMPPKSHRESGRFSLKLTSSEESVLEIGTARDLGFCTSVKKDGHLCNAWINARKVQHCDYHVNLALDKTRAGRMEINGMFRYANQSSDPHRQRGPRSTTLAPGALERRADPRRRDAESGEMYFMGGPTASAASLMDAEDTFGRQEALKKRKKEEAKEKELMKKLGNLGNGAGAEYLRANVVADKAADKKRVLAAGGAGAEKQQREEDAAVPEKPDAEALGLVGDKANVRLSPVRRKRAFQASANSSAGPQAMGWGGANKRGLLQSKRAVSPEKGQNKLNVRAESPKKRARFALQQGIREPGRESLGNIVPVDDDDELDIIK